MRKKNPLTLFFPFRRLSFKMVLCSSGLSAHLLLKSSMLLSTISFLVSSPLENSGIKSSSLGFLALLCPDTAVAVVATEADKAELLTKADDDDDDDVDEVKDKEVEEEMAKVRGAVTLTGLNVTSGGREMLCISSGGVVGGDWDTLGGPKEWVGRRPPPPLPTP